MTLEDEVNQRIQDKLLEITKKQQGMLDCTANGLYHIKEGLFKAVCDIVTGEIIEFHQEKDLSNSDFYNLFNIFSHNHYDFFATFVRNHCTRPEILEQL